jgi:hypothetical protein
MRLIPGEFEIGGEAAAKTSKPLQQFLSPGFARDVPSPSIGDVNFDLIAFLELKGINHSRREPDSEAVSPFGDLHISSPKPDPDVLITLRTLSAAGAPPKGQGAARA